MELPNLWISLGVFASTAATDAVYVMFNGAVSARKRVRAASWSSVWYLLSAFAVISYTRNPLYTLFAAGGSWLGAFCAVTFLTHGEQIPVPAETQPHMPPVRPLP